MTTGKTGRAMRSTRKTGEYLYGLGPAKSLSTKVERMAKRLSKHIARAKSYRLPDAAIVASLERAYDDLRFSAKRLDAVPSNWKPAKGTLGGTPIEEGSSVMLKNTKTTRALYNGYVDDLKAPIYVEKVQGGKLRCSVKSKDEQVITWIPKNHVKQVTP